MDLSMRDKLEGQLRQLFPQSFTSNGALDKRSISMPLLSPEYIPGPSLSSRWTQQLHNSPATHTGDANQKTILIVSLEPKQDDDLMYKTIKNACDVHIGTQTFVFKRGTYETMVHSAMDNSKAVKRIAADISRRTCLEKLHQARASIGQHGDECSTPGDIHTAP
jgi:hypothetical protein